MFIELIRKELEKSDNKVSKTFIDSILNHSKTEVIHKQVTDCTRVCVIITPYGHELVGYAQVIDPKNDVELIGQKVAYDKAKEELWKVVGSIAKTVLMEVKNDTAN